jgi:hypothetical protein
MVLVSTAIAIAMGATAMADIAAAEITHLMSRAGNWPDGLRWIARRVKPSRPAPTRLRGIGSAT